MSTPRKPTDIANPLDVIKKPKKNPPQCVDAPPGDNNKYTSVALKIAEMDACDLHEPSQVKQRVHDYFQICADNDMKPTVSALALSLGTDRRRLWEIANNTEGQLHIPDESKVYIKKAYAILDVLWNDYMQNGKINPVSGIFLAKNHFGYKDQTEYVLTPNNPLGDNVDRTTISEKYKELPE